MSVRPIVDIRLIQFDPHWLDPVQNAANAARIAVREAESGADLIVFPELSNIGYVTPIRVGLSIDYSDPSVDEESFRDLYRERSERLHGRFVAGLVQVAAKYDCHIITGMSRLADSDLMNSSVLIGPSGVIGVHDKLHIPPQEKPFFVPGDALEVFDTELGGIGLAVCYDSRFPEMARYQARDGAEMIVVVYAGADSVLPYLGAEDTLLYRTHVRAQENGVFYAICNRVGIEGHSAFMGRSVVAGPNGEILARGGNGPETVKAVLHSEALDQNRAVVDVMADLRTDVYG